jgi:hypothetical protein
MENGVREDRRERDWSQGILFEITNLMNIVSFLLRKRNTSNDLRAEILHPVFPRSCQTILSSKK